MSGKMSAIIKKSSGGNRIDSGKTQSAQKVDNDTRLNPVPDCKFVIQVLPNHKGNNYFWRIVFFTLMNLPSQSFTIDSLSSPKMIEYIYSNTHNAKSQGWKLDADGTKQWKSKIRKVLDRFKTFSGKVDENTGKFLTSKKKHVNGKLVTVYTMLRKYPEDIHDCDILEFWGLYQWTEKVLERQILAQDAINPAMAAFNCKAMEMYRIITNPENSKEFRIRRIILGNENPTDSQEEKTATKSDAASSSSKTKRAEQAPNKNNTPDPAPKKKTVKKVERYLDFNEASSSEQ